MSLTSVKSVAFSAATLSLLLGTSSLARDMNYWSPTAKLVSFEVTGSVAVPEDAPAETQEEIGLMPMLLAQVMPQRAPAATPSDVDESALRYFARQGDQRRLEAEIARLRALYPNWTPPADPLIAPPSTDAALEEIWQLYSEGKLGQVRQKIAERQSADPSWQPPTDLTDRLALAESRERLINASENDQYGQVIAVASDNPQLLTCSEVDVLWRVAEAFAKTEREQRAHDAYRYILSNCDNGEERVATMQNASRLLSKPLVDDLLKLERRDANNVGEFASIRDNLARDTIAKAGDDTTITVPAETLKRIEGIAETEEMPADARLLGWYYLKRENIAAAEKWFRLALEKESTADAAEGLALALIERDQFAEAEALMHRWRGESDNTRVVYLAAAANLLGLEPRPVLSSEVLNRIVSEVVEAKSVEGARQLGWYSRAFEQHATARAWFSTALAWDANDEPSAYGLALTHQLLGELANLAEIKRIWTGRSERIQLVGVAVTEQGPSATTMQPLNPDLQPRLQPQQVVVQTQPPAQQQVIVQPNVQAAPAPLPRPAATAQPRATQAPAAANTARRGCANHVNPESLAPGSALNRGWCLMDANRPVEAAQAFEIALRSGSDAARRDASYGQSLAYLRAGLVNNAAVAAARAPQSRERARELQTSILAERALGAFERGRFVETLIALDQRAQIAPERIDLMVLRGYAYMRLGRIPDARRIFEAAAGTGSRDAIRGLADIRNMQN
jgi:tetratricopeptide (TPR) repeat protein